jgi:hypothetical protein
VASSSPRRGGIIEGINVTPLVDITLVLLIIFIVTAKIVVTPAVPLDLPRAAGAEELQTVLSVVVPREGSMLVDGEAIHGGSARGSRTRRAGRAPRCPRGHLGGPGRLARAGHRASWTRSARAA